MRASSLRLRAALVASLTLWSGVLWGQADTTSNPEGGEVPGEPVPAAPPTFQVRVTPDGATEGQAPNSGPHQATFTVENTGGLTDTYSLICTRTGVVTCGPVSPTSVTLAGGGVIDVIVSYNVGATGTGVLTLSADGEAFDPGSYTITSAVPPIVTLVAPVLTSGTRAVVRSRQPVIRALFTSPPGGSGIDSTLNSLTWDGFNVTGVARHNRGLIEWEVDSARALAVGDSAEVKAKACSLLKVCTIVTRWVVLPNDQAPVLGFTGAPLEALGSQFSAPFGPGLSVSGAEVETGFSSVPFFSYGGRARSFGLSYSTRQSYPRALVPIDLELPWPAGTPDQVKLVLLDGVVRLDSLVLANPTCATGALKRCRAVLQGDFAASTFSGPTRKWLRVEASVTEAGVTKMADDSLEVVLVDRRSTSYGSGWWPSLGLKLVAAGADRVLVGPTGAATLFRGNGDSLYLAQPGNFSVLKRTASGWHLSQRGSTARTEFDANGRLVNVVERTGTIDLSVAYSGATDQITSVTFFPGKAITVGYNGSAKLATLTDADGRKTKVTINASNQLTYDSLSSPVTKGASTRYVYRTYPGTNTVVLIKRIGTILDTTIVTYDSTFKRRPTQVRLPLVADASGPVTPLIRYVAYERQGFGALRSLDSVYVELKDPRNNWTRSLLNRWGQGRKTWDSLGVIGRTEYRPDGLVIWSEGKTADSSRVFNTYDAQSHLVKRYIVRSVGDTLRLDSLVYDGSHRVIKTIDSRGKAETVTYDAFGQVITLVDKSGATARTWYGPEGLVDSTQAPNAPKRKVFTYDATWKNLSTVVDEGGTTVARTFYDDLGRVAQSQRRITVQKVSGVNRYQWRRDTTYYNAANQADSIIRQRSQTCLGTCEAPPFWVSTSDTLFTRRVGYVYDRAGRDSLRRNDRAEATMYLYDRLHRLVSRRPWTDSMAVKDSIVYDKAGNVAKRITRRGDVVTALFDSRNRDTSSTVPGVGTLRKVYDGHLDQLTRLYVTSATDSIGAVNQELRWGYDRRGRLKADTSYTSATARVTTYTYDAHERPSTMADPVGTWQTRYETARGYADTLLTPFADTLLYTWDSRGRVVARGVGSSGPRHNHQMVWSVNSELSNLTTSIAGSSPYDAADYVKAPEVDLVDDPVSLVPTWTEKQGGGGPTVTWQDSVAYDGWERVVGWTSLRNGAEVASETITYDRAGNTVAGEGEVYDPTTDRLLQRSLNGHTFSYTYDRSGNLTQVRDSTISTATVVVWIYGYNALDQLRSVRRNGTVIARYGYDALGRRIGKRVYSAASGGTVGYLRFVYHGSHVAFEADSAGSIGLRYTWGQNVDDLVGIRDAAGNQYYTVQDKLGTVRGLTKRDGSWVLSVAYRPWGAAFDSAGTQHSLLRYRWTGREYDAETGFYFFRSRYYDPTQRRFVQEDPIGYDGGSNLYTYVENQVLEATDPSGLMLKKPDGAYRGGGGGGGGGSGVNNDLWGKSYITELQEQHMAEYEAGLNAITTEVTITYDGRTETISFVNGVATTSTCNLCSKIPDGGAWFTGMALDGFPDGTAGGTVAAGVFVDSRGSGTYTRAAIGGGLDVSAGGEVGFSESFSGLSVGIQVGYGRAAGGISVSPGGGRTYTTTPALSLYPGVSIHVAISWTTPTYTSYWR